MTHRMLLVAATATALGVAAAPAVAQTPQPDPAALPSTLYLQQASSGTLKGDTLTLKGVAPRTTTFQDRPQRTGGAQTTRSFVSGFGAAFGTDAPNAALEVTDAPASRDVALLELRSPRYDAAKRTLTYTVRRLPSTSATSLAGLAKRNDGAQVKHFGRATLFIDDGGAASTFLLMQVYVPGGTQGSITLSDATLGPASTVAGIMTPSTGIGPDSEGNGLIETNGSGVSFSSSGGGGLTFQLVIAVTPTTTTLDGTATLPDNATVSIAPVGGSATTIANGAFSVPLPSS